MSGQCGGFAPRSYSRAEVEAIAEQYRTWGRWGPDDELGHANYVTERRIVEAAQLIRRGKAFSMALPMDERGPQGGSTKRTNPQHVMLISPHDDLVDGRVAFTDDAVYMPLQSSTQWDALCHVLYDGKAYNDRDASTIDTYFGAKYNSITNLKDRAVGRGVLLDVARHAGVDWLAPGDVIQDSHLEACAEAQGVEVRDGDFVLVRTGQLAERRVAEAWGDYAGGAAPGLGVSAAHFLCPRGVAAVASDTWGVEARPYEAPEPRAPLHIILLANAGVYIGEMWDMEELAADCAADGVFEFFLTAFPLTITGSVGSPINPVALK